MLPIRLHRAQVDLQLHRQWLNAFVAAGRTPPRRYDSPCRNAQPFSTAPSRKSTETQTSTHHASAQRHRLTLRHKHKSKARVAGSVNLKKLWARDDLAEAIKEYDIKKVITLYVSLGNNKPLDVNDVAALAQCTHQCLRQELYKPAATRKREDVDEIVSFAKQLVLDIQKERLMPVIFAHVHLLGVFKESGTRDAGISFWQWLEEQSDEYVSLDVYAVAIDILAINGSPLNELEDLYQNALARFPGTFFAYHLSPGAIVPDRAQDVPIKGLPMSLLQSITLARLLHGDSQKAYLALDTAFRLFPTSVPPRFLQLFQDERPISESYTVFALACRAGVQVPSGHFRSLLAKLKAASDLQSITAHVVSLRVMMAAMYLQLGSSGTLTSNSVSELMIVLTQLFRVPGVGELETKDRRKVVDAVLGAMRQLMIMFARYSLAPSVSVFNSIITNIAGYGRAKEVIGIAVADMKALGLEPNDVTRRSLLTTAGILRDETLVDKFWKEVEIARSGQGANPDGFDLHVYVKAARLAGLDDQARAVWGSHRDRVHAKHVDSIERVLDQPLEELEQTPSAQAIVIKDILEGIEAISADLVYFDEHTKDQPMVQDFNHQAVPLALLSVKYPCGTSDAEMESIYNKLTAEPLRKKVTPPVDCRDHDASGTPAEGLLHVSRTEESSAPHDAILQSSTNAKISITNIPFDRLRFANWTAFNYLLGLAEEHDRQYLEEVDQSIATGVKPPTRNMGFTAKEIEAMKGVGLSSSEDAVRVEQTWSNVNQTSWADVEAKILRLRNIMQ